MAPSVTSSFYGNRTNPYLKSQKTTRFGPPTSSTGSSTERTTFAYTTTSTGSQRIASQNPTTSTGSQRTASENPTPSTGRQRTTSGSPTPSTGSQRTTSGYTTLSTRSLGTLRPAQDNPKTIHENPTTASRTPSDPRHLLENHGVSLESPRPTPDALRHTPGNLTSAQNVGLSLPVSTEGAIAFANALKHAIRCKNSCSYPACRKMTLLLKHFSRCKDRERCRLCQQFTAIVHRAKHTTEFMKSEE